MLTVRDFDEIVLNNPFLTNGTVGYGLNKLLWQFTIHYDPNSVNFPGQGNSTCKFIVIENRLSGKKYKVVREDDHITVADITGQTFTFITDTKEFTKVRQRIEELKKMVSKQIEKYNATIKSIEKTTFNFHLDDTTKFISLLCPAPSDIQQEKIIKTLKRVEKNPVKYFQDPTDTLDLDIEKIAQSILLNIMAEQLEKYGSLIIIDWKSPYEEIIGLLNPLFQKLQISFDERMKKTDDYETTAYLNIISNILHKQGYQILILGEISDTYLLVFIKSVDIKNILKLADKIKLTVRQWKI